MDTYRIWKEQNTEGIHGYKVFNHDWTCLEKQYTCPGNFTENVDIDICKIGMHFCSDIKQCFNYYDFDPNNHVAEVIAWGNVATDGNKLCTDELEIVREIPWNEILSLVNTGKNNIGINNTGNKNSGNCNTGDNNSGTSNTGYRNKGHRNTGHCNTGHFNAGDENSGSYNTGDYNAGSQNTGNHNRGNHNVGNHNLGNGNIGDFNLTDCHLGCFNTSKEPTIMLFNKPSDWTYTDWNDSVAAYILNKMPDSNDEQTPQEWWDAKLKYYEKEYVKAIPNFDTEIFKECTGIDVTK